VTVGRLARTLTNYSVPAGPELSFTAFRQKMRPVRQRDAAVLHPEQLKENPRNYQQLGWVLITAPQKNSKRAIVIIAHGMKVMGNGGRHCADSHQFNVVLDANGARISAYQ